MTIDTVDFDGMIVPDEMDLFIQLPEITWNCVTDWAGIVKVDVNVHNALHYIFIDDNDDVDFSSMILILLSSI
jgi:hypothetical protein